MQLHTVPDRDPDDLSDPLAIAAALHESVTRAVRGKGEVVRLALVALLSGGHLLVEDVPGTGKTLLAKSLAAACGGRFRRVQCTPDLLPSDVTGTTVYNPADGRWDFHPGPVFANILLVDELNRASPRTQAALLEPMEERQVTVDGTTHALPEPFCCIATENPFGSAGTFALPESQLDRFALVVAMGLPGRDAEREILTGVGGTDALARITPVTTPEGVQRTIEAARAVHVAPPVVEYVLDLAAATRSHALVALGASPRATRGLLHAAQAHALISQRTYVSPDDVQAVAPSALAHRIVVDGAADVAASARLVADIVATVRVPQP